MSDPGLPPRVRRLFRLPWRSAARVRKDTDDELRFHVEMRAEELIASGMERQRALADAWSQFGDPDDVRRHALAVSVGNRRRTRVREVGVGMIQDFRFATRQMRRAPLFAGVAVLTIALGIGEESSAVRRSGEASRQHGDSSDGGANCVASTGALAAHHHGGQ